MTKQKRIQTFLIYVCSSIGWNAIVVMLPFISQSAMQMTPKGYGTLCKRNLTRTFIRYILFIRWNIKNKSFCRYWNELEMSIKIILTLVWIYLELTDDKMFERGINS